MLPPPKLSLGVCRDLVLASSINPQRLSSHHHHRRQQPRMPWHHHCQWLPPATTVAITTHHHHWPPMTTTADTNHEEAMPHHHPQQLSACLAMEHVGDDMARCHVVQMVMMHAIITIRSVRSVFPSLSPVFLSY